MAARGAEVLGLFVVCGVGLSNARSAAERNATPLLLSGAMASTASANWRTDSQSNLEIGASTDLSQPDQVEKMVKLVGPLINHRHPGEQCRIPRSDRMPWEDDPSSGIQPIEVKNERRHGALKQFTGQGHLALSILL